MSKINISGDEFDILTPEQTEARRIDFINNPGDGLDKMAKLFGYIYANMFFDKFFKNLKYKDTRGYPDLIKCPCRYRQKFNASYICYGVRCPHR